MFNRIWYLNIFLLSELHVCEFYDVQLDFVPEYGAMVLPLVKHPFIVGFLVAELPNVESETCMNSESTQGEAPNLPQSNYSYGNSLEIQPYQEDLVKTCQITLEERSRAVRISQSLATAYVMDQVRLITFPFYSSFSYTWDFL